MIKILLVEDQRLFRSGVEALVNEAADMEVVGMVEDGAEALSAVEELKPDVVLMDIHMPNLDGIKAASQIKYNFADTKVVFLTTNAEEDLIIRAINVGADGFLLKELYPDTLRQSIRDAYRGQVVLSGEVASILVDLIRQLTNDPLKTLSVRLENRGIYMTRRELEIAMLLVEEKSNAQIAQHFQLKLGTVKNYISDLYLKLAVANRKQAIAFLQDLMVSCN